MNGFKGTIIDETNYGSYVHEEYTGNERLKGTSIDRHEHTSCDEKLSDMVPDILESLERSSKTDVRTKPRFTDSWVIGDTSELEVLHEHSGDNGDVIIGYARDGQLEYHVVPFEYALNSEMGMIADEVVEGVRGMVMNGTECPTRESIISMSTGMLLKRIADIGKACNNDPAAADRMISMMSKIVCRHTMGTGIFETLLSDPMIEDIYVDAPCSENRIHVTVNGVDGFNSQVRCRTNLIADDREIKNLISILKRNSGLTFCESSPVLETDMDGSDARATIIGYPTSPEGNAVAIRKHSVMPWTLTRLIGNGTLDKFTAGLLSFLVDMRSTVLIGGARGSGKSSLLSALMFEFPLSQRILTIEDTLELPAENMRRIGYKVQSMLTGDGMNGDAYRRSEEALRISLRMGESSIVMGEVRGEESRTLYHSMRTGKAGSSVMGTIHGDSVSSVYDRVVHDLGVPEESFAATDMVMIMGSRRSRGDVRNTRELTEIAATSDTKGSFVNIISGNGLNDDALDTPAFRRIMGMFGMTKDDVIDDITMRSEIRGFLAETAETDGLRFYGPEWILRANEFMGRGIRSGRDPDDVVNGFKEWFRRYNDLVR